MNFDILKYIIIKSEALIVDWMVEKKTAFAELFGSVKDVSSALSRSRD
jgi:hypothetical protein